MFSLTNFNRQTSRLLKTLIHDGNCDAYAQMPRAKDQVRQAIDRFHPQPAKANACWEGWECHWGTDGRSDDARRRCRMRTCDYEIPEERRPTSGRSNCWEFHGVAAFRRQTRPRRWRVARPDWWLRSQDRQNLKRKIQEWKWNIFQGRPGLTTNGFNGQPGLTANGFNGRPGLTTNAFNGRPGFG